MTHLATRTTTPEVVIIGAGFGGLSVALELKKAGIETFTILDRQDEVGGVWQANDYPGAACDVPSVTISSLRTSSPTGHAGSAARARSSRLRAREVSTKPDCVRTSGSGSRSSVPDSTSPP